MEKQEAIQRMVGMGFEDVTAQYNAEHQSAFAYVFFHPSEGSHGLRCWCDEDQGLFNVLRFVEQQAALGRFESGPLVACEACGAWFVPEAGYYEPGEYAYCANCCHW